MRQESSSSVAGLASNEVEDAENQGENEEEYEETENNETIQLKMQNMVATVNVETLLDLPRIAQSARNAEYNPTRFQAVIMRIREPRTTALIFASGKVIITGAKNIDDCKAAGRKYVAILQKVGFPAHFAQFKIQNMTATCDLGFPIRLESFLYKYPTQCTYEPEVFPGLSYRMEKPKVTILVFVSGKIVITGAKDPEDLAASVRQIYDKLFEFRKRNVVVTAVKAS